MLSLLAILLSLILLIVLAYRGISVLVLGPAMALLAVVLSPGTPLMASYTQVFMTALGGFVALFFPLFLLGAMFGKLMEDSGAARSISQGIITRLGAQRAVLAIVLACAILTYGGVSLFVVAFAVYPIAVELFRSSGIPKRLIPGTIALGAFSFTMTALPGTPAIQNAIPMPYFGTTVFAAPGLGLVAGAVMFALGMAWLNWRVRRARLADEGFGVHDDAPQSADPSSSEGQPRQQPRFIRAIAPILAVLVLNWLFASLVFPSLDTSYLASTLYGNARPEAVRGTWSIIAALVLAMLLLVVLMWRSLPPLKDSLEAGATSAVLPIFNTASQVGYGAVIASLAGFAVIRDAVLNIAPGNPLISLSIAVNLLAGITGSASGGMSIALQTLGDVYLQMGAQAGMSPELLHRVTAVATGGLDTLPHNGAVITLLGICQLTHRQSYLDIFIVAVLAPLVALGAIVFLGTTFGSF